MDKQNVVSTYNKILFGLKNEILIHATMKIKPWKHYVKWDKPDTKGQKMYDFTYNEVPSQMFDMTKVW